MNNAHGTLTGRKRKLKKKSKKKVLIVARALCVAVVRQSETKEVSVKAYWRLVAAFQDFVVASHVLTMKFSTTKC